MRHPISIAIIPAYHQRMSWTGVRNSRNSNIDTVMAFIEPKIMSIGSCSTWSLWANYQNVQKLDILVGYHRLTMRKQIQSD